MKLALFAALLTLLSACSVAPPACSPNGVYNVRTFGAVGDGVALDTAAINRAIDAASANGGGEVLLPPGQYLCYSIHLKSDITLKLSSGSEIIAAGSPESGKYDAPEHSDFEKYQDFGHTHFHNSLIWGENLHDVAIIGPGLIFGKGLYRGGELKPGTGDTGDDRLSLTATTPSTEVSYPDAKTTLAAGIGNKTIALRFCHNVLLRDFSILQGGHFAILATGADNLTIDNLKIDTNRDGIDIDCCRDVHISNCSINSPWDDAIVLKSSYGLGVFKTTENVTVDDCYVTGAYELGTLLDNSLKLITASYHPGERISRTGRIKLGTEASGGFHNIAISNCILDRCQGLALESVDGAELENVAISNITMRDITSAPIFIRVGDRNRGLDVATTSSLHNVTITNIVSTSKATRFPCIISGIPGNDVRDIAISHVQLIYPGDSRVDDATTRPSERTTLYPDPIMFGPLPASGFYIRHCSGLSLDDIHIEIKSDDTRPFFFLNDVKHAQLHSINFKPQADLPSYILQNIQDVWLQHVSGAPDAQLKQEELKQY